ncbi:MAG: virginiamycin B lyase family protein [Gemmatimonadota bacterium]
MPEPTSTLRRPLSGLLEASLAVLSTIALLLPFLPAPVQAQTGSAPEVEEWHVEWEGRPRDPHVAPDGRVWFVGQQGNYIAVHDPATDESRRYEIPEGTHPHSLIIDGSGIVWYMGNRNATIGRLDPETGDIREIDAQVADPHTPFLDGEGNLWFTAQQASRVGRMDLETEEIDIIDPFPGESVRPYGIKIDPRGRIWVDLFGTNYLAMIHPETLEVTRHELPREEARPRRMAITSDGLVWYGDFRGGYLGRLDPETGEFREWMVPGGEDAAVYAVEVDDRDRIWFSEFGTSNLVGFDPDNEEFFGSVDLSHGVRHMNYDSRTGLLWFCTDANNCGSAEVGPPGVALR